MIAPDHWAPLVASLIRRRYGKATLITISALVGLAHGILSAVLALIVTAVSVRVIPMSYIKYASVALLLLVSIGLLINALRERNKEYSNIGHMHVGAEGSMIVSVLPDPSVIPIIFTSLALGLSYTFLVSIGYVISSALSLVLIMLLINHGISLVLGRINPHSLDYAVIAILLLTALYIYLA